MATTPEKTTGAEILVVEDEGLIRWSVQRALQEAGHTVTVANDGSGALAHLKTHSFDLVITDLHMPGMDGLRVAECVDPSTPVLFISADLDPPPWAALGRVRAFIPKPFDMKVLTKLVSSMLGKGRGG